MGSSFAISINRLLNASSVDEVLPTEIIIPQKAFIALQFFFSLDKDILCLSKAKL